MPKRHEIQLSQPKAQVFDALTRSLQTLDGMKVKSADPSTGHVEASTQITFRSWGEKIRIDVLDSGSGSTVQISSGNKAQLTSWGKNDENIANIERALHSALHSSGPSV